MPLINFLHIPEDGHLVRNLRVPGRGMQKCVLMRKQKKGHFSVELESSMFANAHEELDDGSVELAPDQVIKKFRGAADQITGGFEGGHVAPQPVVTTPAQQSSNKGGTTNEAEAVSDEDEETDDDDDIGSCMAGGLFGYMMDSAVAGRSSNKPKAVPKGTSHPPASSPQAKQAKSSASCSAKPGAGTPHVPSPSAAACAKGRGKAAKIPQSVDEMLDHEGFPKIEADIRHQVQKMRTVAILNQVFRDLFRALGISMFIILFEVPML